MPSTRTAQPLDVPLGRDLDLRFFVLGAQKSATSWLYFCLRDHPEVLLPSVKNEYAYLGSPLFREQGPGWYADRFPEARAGLVAGDVAVDYLLDPAAPAAIQQYVENPRLVVLLRNPVDRFVSAYFWSLRKSQIPNRPLQEVLPWFLDQPAGFPERHPERLLDELVTRGFYATQLRPYVETFGAESLLAILYDEVKSDPASVVRRVYRHIGVDEDVEPASLGSRPKVNTRNRAVLALERLWPSRKLSFVTDRLHRLLSRAVEPPPELTASQRAALLARFRPHIDDTKALLATLPPENRPASLDTLDHWS